jgi:hypothetical protein
MIDLLDKIALLSEMAHKSIEPASINLGFLCVKLSANIVNEFESRLKEQEIEFDKTGISNFEIKLEYIGDKIHFSIDEDVFLQDSNSEESLFTEKKIVILCYEESFLFYDYTTNKIHIGSNQVGTNFLVGNTKSYIEFRKILCGDEFADYYNSLNNQIVFYTGAKGVLKLSYPKIPIKLNSSIDYSKIIKNLTEQLKSKDYSIHFKNALFGIEKNNGVSQIKAFFDNIVILVQEADNNYQLQLKNFSFDKLSNDLKKEKEKYFTSLREILNKIFSQIIGVPISIAASTFASYKVENKFILCLILLAFSIYVFFAIYLQTIYKKDVKEIEKDFEKDFGKILEKSGLPQKDIIDEKDKIARRIKNIKNTILAYIISVSILAVMFIAFLTNQLIQPINNDNSKTITVKTKYANITLTDSLVDKPKIKVKPNSTIDKKKDLHK